MKRNFIDYCILILKGMAMGVADLVPGVSGGTIAFICYTTGTWNIAYKLGGAADATTGAFAFGA